MDAFKLAFETTIVGMAGFLWVAAAIDLISPTFLARVKSALVATNEKLTGVVLLAVAYGLGSAILPISAQLVNDEHWPLPDDAIRCRVAVEEESRLNPAAAQAYSRACSWSSWNYLVRQVYAKEKADPPSGDEANRKIVLARFDVLESQVLAQSQGANQEELLRQLHERMVVLRGTFFSGFILFLICLFGCIATESGQPRSWWRTSLGIALASSFTVVLLRNGLEDLANPNIFDIPILEAVLGAVSVFGGLLAIRGVKSRPYLRVQYLLVIICGAALSYGGWMWSEILYNQQLIISSVGQSHHSEPAKVHTSLFLETSPSPSSAAEDVH